MCLSNHISGFFDHQYLCKESIDISDFSHVDNRQGKVACQTTFFGGVSPVKSFIQVDCRTLWSLISWAESIDILVFTMESIIKGR